MVFCFVSVYCSSSIKPMAVLISFGCNHNHGETKTHTFESTHQMLPQIANSFFFQTILVSNTMILCFFFFFHLIGSGVLWQFNQSCLVIYNHGLDGWYWTATNRYDRIWWKSARKLLIIRFVNKYKSNANCIEFCACSTESVNFRFIFVIVHWQE